MNEIEKSQRESIRSAVNKATGDIEQENRSLSLKLLEKAKESDTKRKQILQYEKDFKSLNIKLSKLSEHKEQNR